ncbi:MAG: radical SAM protein [Candidatus Micrarchaeota archaeon]
MNPNGLFASAIDSGRFQEKGTQACLSRLLSALKPRGGSAHGPEGSYSRTKWVWHKENIDLLLEGYLYGKDQSQPSFSSVIRPITASFVPTLSCNYHCPKCTYRDIRNVETKGRFEQGLISSDGSHHGPMMDERMAMRTLTELKALGVKAVIFTGGGEPLLHPKIFDFMFEAKRLGFQIGLFTNGSLLDKEIAKDMLNYLVPELQFIRISLNAADERTYSRHHGVSPEFFHVVCENIRFIAECRALYGFVTSSCPDGWWSMKSPTCGVGFIVGGQNADSLQFARPLFESFEKDFPGGKIDQKAFRPLVEYGGRSKRQTAVEVIEMAIKELQRLCVGRRDILFNAARFRSLADPQQNHCSYCLAHPWRIGAWSDGRIFLCDEHNGDPDFCIGDLKERRLEDIWIGDQRRDVIERLNRSLFHERCPPICILSDMNGYFEDLLHLDNSGLASFLAAVSENLKLLPPEHVNFL